MARMRCTTFRKWAPGWRESRMGYSQFMNQRSCGSASAADGRDRRRLHLVVAALGLTAGLLNTGCQGVPVHQQRLVAQPNMQFAASPAFSTDLRLLSQIETGAAMSGGATAAGCTSCR